MLVCSPTLYLAIMRTNDDLTSHISVLGWPQNRPSSREVFPSGLVEVRRVASTTVSPGVTTGNWEPQQSSHKSHIVFLSSGSSRQTGQSQPTSPQYQKNSKQNYETSRSVPRSFNNKRHKPPDAGCHKTRDEGRPDLG